MANETLARRYATAVFALANESGNIGGVGNDLSQIVRTITTDAATAEFFISPIVQRVDKEKALLATFSGKVSDVALHTLLLLVRKRREAVLVDLLTEYRKLELASRGLEPLTVFTAQEIPDGELRSMVERLEKTYSKKFDVIVKREPALIGGVRIVMGDRRIDGSVAGRLEELTRTLFA